MVAKVKSATLEINGTELKISGYADGLPLVNYNGVYPVVNTEAELESFVERAKTGGRDTFLVYAAALYVDPTNYRWRDRIESLNLNRDVRFEDLPQSVQDNIEKTLRTVEKGLLPHGLPLVRLQPSEFGTPLGVIAGNSRTIACIDLFEHTHVAVKLDTTGKELSRSTQIIENENRNQTSFRQKVFGYYEANREAKERLRAGKITQSQYQEEINKLRASAGGKVALEKMCRLAQQVAPEIWDAVDRGIVSPEAVNAISMLADKETNTPDRAKQLSILQTIMKTPNCKLEVIKKAIRKIEQTIGSVFDAEEKPMQLDVVLPVSGTTQQQIDKFLTRLNKLVNEFNDLVNSQENTSGDRILMELPPGDIATAQDRCATLRTLSTKLDRLLGEVEFERNK